MTRLANTALDRVAPESRGGRRHRRGLWRDRPPVLPGRCDPRNSYAAGARPGTRFSTGPAETSARGSSAPRGVVPVAAAEALARLLDSRGPRGFAWRLTALHELVSLTGSLVLGLAVRARGTTRRGLGPLPHRRGVADRAVGPRCRGRGRSGTAAGELRWRPSASSAASSTRLVDAHLGRPLKCPL
jgi:hypothetical protein